MQKNLLINIQFLRALAAMLVVFYHTAGHYYAAGGKTTGNVFSFIEEFGYIGVDIFFVISGYIIWLTTKKIDNISNIFTFLYKRLTRIYLTYWSFVIPLLIGYMYLGKDLSHYNMEGSIFLTSISINQLIIPVSWTLTYELYFYISFVFLLFMPKKSSIYMLIFLFIFIILVQMYAYFFLDLYAHEKFYSASSIYTFFLSPYVLEFIAGCFVAYYFEYKRIKNLKIVFTASFSSFLFGIFYQNIYLEHSLVSGYYMVERVFFFGTMSIFFLIGLVEMNKRNIFIFPKFSLLIGNASYSLYLSHTILLSIFYFTGIRASIEHIGNYQTLFMLLLIIIMILYSIFHYRFIEHPLMYWSKKLRYSFKLY